MGRTSPLPAVVFAVALSITAVLPGRLVSGTIPPAWSDFHYVRAAALAAVVVFAVLMYRERVYGAGDDLSLGRRVLRALLVVHVSLVVVLLGKYLLGSIPATWSHDVIQYYSASPSLVDLYDKERALTPPIVTPIYPPGMFAVAAALKPVLGEGRHVLRFVVVGGVFLSAAVIGKVVAREHGWKWGLGGGALFLAVFPQIVWSGAPTKPEYLAVALSLAGIAAVSEPTEDGIGGYDRIVAAGVLFGAALSVKFTVAAGVAGALLFLAIRRHWRRLILLGATTGIIFGGTYLVLSRATGGGIVFFTLLSNMMEPDFQKAFRLGIMVIGQSFFVVLCVTVAMIKLNSLRSSDRAGVDVLVAVITVVAVGLGIATTARPLSSANYVLEAVAVGVLLIALVIPTGEGRPSGIGSVRISALVGVFLAVHLPSQVALVARDVSDPTLPPSVVDRLKSNPDGYVLSDPRYVQDVLDAGLEPLVVDSYHITSMIEEGIIDARVVTGPMLEGRVPVAVLADDSAEDGSRSSRRRPHSDAVMAVLRDRYRCRDHEEGGVVLCRWSGKRGPTADGRAQE